MVNSKEETFREAYHRPSTFFSKNFQKLPNKQSHQTQPVQAKGNMMKPEKALEELANTNITFILKNQTLVSVRLHSSNLCIKTSVRQHTFICNQTAKLKL